MPREIGPIYVPPPKAKPKWRPTKRGTSPGTETTASRTIPPSHPVAPPRAIPRPPSGYHGTDTSASRYIPPPSPPDLHDFVYERLRRIDPSMAFRLPNTTMALAATPGLSDHDLHVVTSGLSGGFGFFGHVLHSIENVAWSHKDQAVVDRYNALPLDERRLLATSGDLLDGPITPEWIANNQMTPGALNWLAGRQLNLPSVLEEKAIAGDARARQLIVALQKLFPMSEYQWKFHKPGVLSRAGDVVGSITNESGQLMNILTAIPSAIVAEIGAGVQAVTYDPASGGAAFGTPQYAPHGWGLPNPLAVAMRSTRASPFMGLAQETARAAGIGPDDPRWHYVTGVNSLVFSWELDPLVIAGKIDKGVKLASEVITPYRQLVNDAEALRAAGYTAEAYEKEQQAKGIANAMSRSSVTRTAFRVLAKTPDEMLVTRSGTKMVEELSRAIERAKGSPAELTRFFPRNLPAELAGKLAPMYGRGVGAEDLRSVLSAWANGEGADSLATIRQQLELNQSFLDQIKASAGPVGEGTSARLDPATQSQLDRLLSQRLVLKARYGADMVKGYEPLVRMPETSFLARAAHEGATNAFERGLARVLTGRLPAPALSARVDNGAAINDVAEQIRVLEGHVANNPILEATYRPRIDELRSQLDHLAETNGRRKLWVKTQVSLDDLWTDIHKRRIYVHTSPTDRMPPDALAHDLRQFESFMKATGVGVKQRNAVLDEFIKAKSDADFFRGIQRLGNAVADAPGMAAAERARMQQALGELDRQRIAEFFDTLASARKYGILPTLTEVPGGGPMLVDVPVLPGLAHDGAGIVALPAGPEEMVSHMLLPDYESVINATAYHKRLMRSVYAKGGIPGKFLVRLLEKGGQLNRWATKFWRDLILVPRMLGALQGRIIGEENFRAWAFDKVGAFNDPRQWVDHVKRGQNLADMLNGDFLGQISNQLRDEVALYDKTKVVYQAGDAGRFDAISARFSHLAQGDSTRLVQQLARDPVAAYDWINSEGKWLLQPMKDNLERHRLWLDANPDELARIRAEGVTGPATTEDAVRSWLDRRAQEIDVLSGGNPEVRNALATGTLEAHQPKGLLDERAALQHQYDELTQLYWEHMRSGAPDRGGQALDVATEQRTVKEMIAEIDKDLERRPGIPVGTREFGDTLAQLERDGLYKPPAQVSGWANEPIADPVRRDFKTKAFGWFSKQDVKYGRGPVLSQFYDEHLNRLLAHGWDQGVAEKRALYMAAADTSEMMYDLATRTGFQRFMRNIAPFFPAWQEFVETYGIKVPAQYGVFGVPLVTARLKDLQRTFKDAGLDLSQLAAIPGLGIVISALTGSPVALEAQFRPKNLSFVAANITPGLGPLAAVLSSLVAKNDKTWASVNNVLQPYGEPQLGPFGVNRFIEFATGKSSPFEIASRGQQETQWMFSIHQAEAELWTKRKKSFPDVKGYKDNSAGYNEAVSAWLRQFTHDSEWLARKYALARSALYLIFPGGPITLTDAERKAVTEMYAKIDKLPKGDPGISDAYAAFMRRFPAGDLYITPNSVKLTDQATIDKLSAEEKSFYAPYTNGLRRTLDPEEFALLGAYLSSQRDHIHKREAIIGQFGSTPREQTIGILTNYGKYKDLMNGENRAWDLYGAYNHRGVDLYTQMVEQGRKAGKSPQFTDEQDLLLSILRSLGEALPLLTDGGQKPQGYGDIRRTIMTALDRYHTQFGEPKDPVLKNVSWYFANVLDPYFTKADAIFSQADQVAGADQGAFFDQYRHLVDSQTSTTHGGITYPTPEEFSWGNQSESERNALLVKWATRPVEWLTTFQRERIGVGGGDAATAFFDFVNAQNAALKKVVLTNHISYSSNQYHDMRMALDRLFKTKAAEAGLADVYSASLLPPYQRLLAMPPITVNNRQYSFADDPTFAQVAGSAAAIWQYLQGQGLSPGGSSQAAQPLQLGLFAQIESLRKQDSTFKGVLDLLETSLAKRGTDRLAKEDLYMALFFDNWNGAPATLRIFNAAPAIPRGQGQYNLVTVRDATLSALTMKAFLSAEQQLGTQIVLAGPYATFRTYQDQAYLFNLRKTGQASGPAAAPGDSFHERGDALDADTSQPNFEQVRQALLSLGFCQFSPSTDPGHFSFNGCG